MSLDFRITELPFELGPRKWKDLKGLRGLTDLIRLWKGVERCGKVETRKRPGCSAVVRGDIKPRTVAYMAQTLLQSIHHAQSEFHDAFGPDNYRKSIRPGITSNHTRLYPPDTPPHAPMPRATPAQPPSGVAALTNAGTQAGAHAIRSIQPPPPKNQPPAPNTAPQPHPTSTFTQHATANQRATPATPTLSAPRPLRCPLRSLRSHLHPPRTRKSLLESTFTNHMR